jgi:hypothetical protein
MTDVEPIKQWLLETVRLMVDRPEDVTVEPLAGDLPTLQVSVHQFDIGKVIGKQGRTARALRTMVAAIGMVRGTRWALDIVELR